LASLLEENGGDFREAAVCANRRIDDLVKLIVEMVVPFDAFDVLEAVRISELLINPNDYRESEHEGSAAVVEITALILASRTSREGTAPDKEDHRADASAVIEPIIESARQIVSLGSMARLLLTVVEQADLGSLQMSAILREVHVRNISYPHMLEDTLDLLFDDAEIETLCLEVLGYTVREARSVLTSIERNTESNYRAWGQKFEELHQLFVAETTREARDPSGYAISEDVRAAGNELLDSIWLDPANRSVFTTEQIADSSGLPGERVQRILEGFSFLITGRSATDGVQSFLAGSTPFRSLPILRDPSGSMVVVHESLLAPSIRERVELLLKRSSRWNDYQVHRARILEEDALRYLATIFPTAQVHHGLKHFVPNPKSATEELLPSGYTKRVEGDGLLVIDDVAIVVEAKAGSVALPRRISDPVALTRDLKSIITKAQSQSERMRSRILIDGGLRLEDDSWLDLGQVREVQTIAVSLEDLSGIATVTSELVDAGFLNSDHLPWIVSLHDLRIVSELVDRPSEFLLYLRRRTERRVTERFHAVDEMDFFLEFFNKGLYVEPDPDQVTKDLPHLARVSVASKRRFKNQGLRLLTSRTDDLDAWYFFQQGVRHLPAPKPRMNANGALLGLIDFLRNHQVPGWLRIGTTLLDHAGPVQKTMSRYPQQLRASTAIDGKQHQMTMVGGTRSDNTYVICWAVPGVGEDLCESKERIRLYVQLKKHQAQASLGAGLLFSLDGSDSPEYVIYDNCVPEENRLIGSKGA
jgi:hypothetical protein